MGNDPSPSKHGFFFLSAELFCYAFPYIAPTQPLHVKIRRDDWPCHLFPGATKFILEPNMRVQPQGIW